MKLKTIIQKISSGTRFLIVLVSGLSLYLFAACGIPKAATGSIPVTDPVCNMKINDVSEAYSWKYKGKAYYFDSNTCKQTFKMNPEKFINNSCNQVK
jgi:YHS domain-containing protein